MGSPANDDWTDGIYFGMPDEAYHSINRLSASGIKTIVASPLQYWIESPMNPLRKPDRDSPARKLGRAYHKLLLEGEEAFEGAYAVSPSKDDHAEVLDTEADLRTFCEENGLDERAEGFKRKGGKAELCARIRQACMGVTLWPDVMDEFNRTLGDREILTPDQWQEIQMVRYVLHHMPEIRSAFTGGFPEVSILYTDEATGVKMKCRLDYLKPRKNAAAILDLKSFGNVMDRPIEEIPETEIARNDYFIQPIAYTAGRNAMRRLWAKQGREILKVVSGPEPSDEWLSSVLGPEKVAFNYVFCQTGGVPNIIACEFVEGEAFGGLGWQTNAYWTRGHGEYRYGIAMYQRCMAKYGPDAPWIINYGVKKLRDEPFPAWALQKPIPFCADEAAE